MKYQEGYSIFIWEFDVKFMRFQFHMQFQLSWKFIKLN